MRLAAHIYIFQLVAIWVELFVFLPLLSVLVGLEAGSSGLGQKRAIQSGMAAAPKRPAKSMMW